MDTNQATVLVTGTSSGFGALTSRTLARRGYRVFAGMRQPAGKNAGAAAALVAWADHENLPLRVVDLDVTDDASVEAAIGHVVAVAGRLDVVVNNAGVLYFGPLEAFTPDQVRQQFETNVFGVLRVNRAALPHMRSRRSGLLLLVGSILGRIALPDWGLYAATKFALEGLAEGYRLELAPLGIEAAIVEPGPFPTTLWANGVPAADRTRVADYPSSTRAGASSDPAGSAAPDGPRPDPQRVADTIADLIARPPGTRPLRTVVAEESQRRGAEILNAASEQVIRAVARG